MSYWEDRQVETYLNGEKKVNAYFSKLEQEFVRTRKNILKEINDFYVRYADENGLSYADAQKSLNKQEMGDLKDFIKKSYENIGTHNTELENLSMKARVTRLQEMQLKIQAQLDKLYAIDYQENAEKMMHDVYEDAYYRTWYNTDVYHGVHSGFNGVNPTTIDQLIKYPFNGANFSDRVWKQKIGLQQRLEESLNMMLVQGKNPQTLATEFAKKMNSSKMEAYRLLHTESSYLISEAAHEVYKADGVEKYIIIATLDSKTCPACGAQDGKIYEMNDDVMTGVNKPPFHPFCRCTDGAYYGNEQFEDEKRIAMDEDGNNYRVTANMTYSEWKEKIKEHNLSSDLDNMGKPHVFANEVLSVKAYSVTGSENISTQAYSSDSVRLISIIENAKENNINLRNANEIIVVKSKTINGAAAAYDNVNDTFIFNEKICDTEWLNKFLSVGNFAAKDVNDIIYHESIHREHWESAKRFQVANGKKYATIIDAKRAKEQKLREYVVKQISNDNKYIENVVSRNALYSFVKNKNLNELVADASVIMKNGKLSDEVLGELVKEVLL